MRPLLIFSTLLSLCLAQIEPAQKTENCPLLGPVFPAPTELKSSSAIKAAIQTFPKLLEQALGAGLLDNETTSFSLNIFSGDDTLFETHFAAPGLNGSLAAGTLNNQTVYRVGSLSKLWSMYTFLLSAPGNQLDQPITKFIPELVNASSENLGDGTEWEDITIRSLAGHLSGLGRDCKFMHGVQCTEC
jgi:CubicO group peptidase (beta-lactamase class C family)